MLDQDGPSQHIENCSAGRSRCKTSIHGYRSIPDVDHDKARLRQLTRVAACGVDLGKEGLEAGFVVRFESEAAAASWASFRTVADGEPTMFRLPL